MDRRDAVKNTVFGMGALVLGSACNANVSKNNRNTKMEKALNFWVQLFTIPGLVDQDLKGTLKTLSEIGYKEVEFFGPYPFSAEETKKNWEGLKQQLGLKNNAFYGYSVEDTAKMLSDNGLQAPSFHADLITMQTGMTKMLDELSKLNAKYVVIPALMSGRDSLDDYKKLAESFNQFGEQMSKYGMQFVYHNHGYEHIEMDGQIPMHFLIQNTNPDFVQFELDIFWMQAAGADPIEFLKTYPNRFRLLHLKDARETFRFSGDGGTPDQWMAGFPKMSDPGDGIFDIAGIIKQARKSGAFHFFLERDLAPDPLNTLKNSFKNLNAMAG